MKPLLENWCKMNQRSCEGTLKKITTFKNMPMTISEALKKQIIIGKIAGGTQLKQEEIAKRFNVSLVPVREAIIQLQAQGLVSCVRNKGAVVTDLSLEEMNDSFQLRIILETGAIKQAIPKMQEPHILRIQKLCKEMEQEHNPIKWSRLNWLFHESLYTPTQNKKLMHMIEDLFVTIQRYSALRAPGNNNPIPKAKCDHRSLIQACKQKDTTKAMDLIEQHIESERQALETNMTS